MLNLDFLLLYNPAAASNGGWIAITNARLRTSEGQANPSHLVAGRNEHYLQFYYRDSTRQ